MKLKLVAVALAALAPVVAMLGYNEFAMRSQRDHEVRAQAEQAARQASSEIERIVEGLHSLLIAVRAMPAVRDMDTGACTEALKSVASDVPNIRMIFVVDLQGRPVCGSVEPPEGVNFADRDYFKRALADGDFVVGAYTKSRMSDTAVLPVAMPVIVDGKPRAVVVSGVRLDWLQARITERGVAPGNAVTIADSSGTILARVPLPERFVGTVIPADFQKLVNADRPGVIEVKSQDGSDRVLGYRPISTDGSPLYVSAGFSKTEAFAPINHAMMTNIAAIAGGALVAFFAAIFIGNRFLLVPIASIADVMQLWRNGELSARTRMLPTDEIHAVGASLDELLDELDERRRLNEKAAEERMLLVSELAHRVKNGFTLVQAIARQTFARAEPEGYQSFVETLASLAATYDLLLHKEATASTVEEVISAALKAHAGSGGAAIRLAGPTVEIGPDLALPLSLVVHELATNATKYGSLGSARGTLSIAWSCEKGRVRLLWTETGGPVVSTPASKGFGSVLIERAFPSRAHAKLNSDFRSEGLVFEIEFDAAGPENRTLSTLAADA